MFRQTKKSRKVLIIFKMMPNIALLKLKAR